MKRYAIGAAFGLWLGLGAAALAEDVSTPVVVVELYTSQGCSSCPPADAFFGELTQDARVMPLALHVDYWDYIGWEDVFANPRHTERQKSYAYAQGSRTIYTPQMIVDGAERVEGNRPDAVSQLVAAHLARGALTQLEMVRDGGSVHIRAKPVPGGVGPMSVQLVRYTPEATVSITRGENAGRKITYHNIVTSWQKLGDWAGDAPLDLTAKAEGDAPIVVILQLAGPAEIVAAAALR